MSKYAVETKREKNYDDGSSTFSFHHKFGRLSDIYRFWHLWILVDNKKWIATEYVLDGGLVGLWIRLCTWSRMDMYQVIISGSKEKGLWCQEKIHRLSCF